ncbi:hypothetical protein IM697_22695 [Streptomyces ferrugineus]|uniref:Secreted protein n=1 Tax=Streptomyces ferrugineus TaxID=1413221 RepID=A0A7M2SZD5_9ACTN|nr:hypothetical protein [Streptomyces ferrugineus]QOV40933.1 hypothetical protein IM697_22695 [Streptomyces ferrugineus]
MRRGNLIRTAATAAMAAGLAIGASAAPGAAADRSYIVTKQGADWGQFYDDGEFLICDEEADGHGVYLQYRNEEGDTRSWTDSGGADGVCGSGDATDAISAAHWFRVCERINNRPDKCSDKAYITWGD